MKWEDSNSLHLNSNKYPEETVRCRLIFCRTDQTAKINCCYTLTHSQVKKTSSYGADLVLGIFTDEVNYKSGKLWQTV